MSNIKTVKLSEVCIIEKGTTGIQKAIPGQYPLVTTSEERKTHNTFQFEAEAVIVPIVSSTGHGHASIKRIHFQKGKFALGTILCAIIPKDKSKLSAEYLYLFLDLNKERELVGRMKGMANVTLPLKEIGNIEIPIPHIRVQEQIVATLNGQLSKVRSIKQTYETTLKASEKLFPSALRQIFEEGKKNGWEERTLGKVCEIARGGSPRPIKSYITTAEDGINWIKISDASASVKYIYKTRQKIRKEGLHKTRMVQPGDFLLTNSMSYGRPYIMKTTGAIHDGWLLLRPDKSVLEEYLYYFLMSDEMYRQFTDLAGGAVVQNLNIDLVKTVKILIPPLPEQEKIIKKLNSLSQNIESFTKHQSTGCSILNSLEPSFFREAFLTNKTHV